MVDEIVAKSILNKQKKRDDWFLVDYTVNPYQGCTFRCVYCYIRGSKYGTHSTRRLSVKVNAPELLAKQLERKAEKGEYGMIGVASQEAYLPVEEKLGMTRQLLTIILTHRFPVHVLTKSTLVLRDLDILKAIDRQAILPVDLQASLGRGTIVSTSISTLDRKLAKIFEPGAPAPEERLETIARCKEEGFLVGVNYIPVLPYLSDTDEHLEAMVKTAKVYGVDFVLIGGLTLFGNGPDDCRTQYYKTLQEHFPRLVPEYKRLFRIFFSPPKTYCWDLEKRAKRWCERYGVKNRIA